MFESMDILSGDFINGLKAIGFLSIVSFLFETEISDLTESAGDCADGIVSSNSGFESPEEGLEIRGNTDGCPGGFNEGIAQMVVASRDQPAVEGSAGGAVGGIDQTGVSAEFSGRRKPFDAVNLQGDEGCQEFTDAWKSQKNRDVGICF